jgi:hypothetical protein
VKLALDPHRLRILEIVLIDDERGVPTVSIVSERWSNEI